MTLTLTLPPEVEGALAEEARHKGTTPENVALDDLRHLYIHHMEIAMTPSRGDPTLAIFDLWEGEDASSDPDEITRRNQ